jgi:FkbH-like protein
MTNNATALHVRPLGGVKCVVWDLDETLWRGTLLEGGGGELAPGVERIVRELDQRGILQSVASKNDHDTAWPRLEALGVADCFLHPQICWEIKARSIKTIAERLGIGLDAVAFIDDQPIERDEVAFLLPEVRVIDAAELPTLLERPEFTPEFITNESRQRRSMYRADIERKAAEDRFEGTRDAFLARLNMRMKIRRAADDDLQRARELTIRTNQLNTNGRTYSYSELTELASSPDHLLLVAELEDRYGSSGTIGLSLIDTAAQEWTIRLLIMSCRVLTRGVGTVLLGHILRRARRSEVQLRAIFVPTDRNRQMYVTYRFAGFRKVATEAESILLEHDLTRIPAQPAYIQVADEAEVSA